MQTLLDALPRVLPLALAALLAACGGGSDTDPSADGERLSADARTLDEPRRQALARTPVNPVAPADAAQQLMDYAQQVYPSIFAGSVPTLSLGPFAYRHYAATGVYLGVSLQDTPDTVAGGVYVMGGAFGATPAYVGPLTNFVTPVAPGFDATAQVDKLLVTQGGTATLRVNVQRLLGWQGPVTLTLQNLPAGVTAPPVTVPADASQVDIPLLAQASAPHSLPTTATVRASGGALLATQDITVTVRGTPGTIDTSFGGGTVVTSVNPSEDYAHAVAVQPDGKVLTVGTTATSTGTVVAVVRHQRDGTLDPSFGTAGQVVTQIGARGDSARAVAVQPDGRIVVAGWTDATGTDADFLVLRYLADGRLDPSFGQGGAVVVPFGNGTDRAFAVAVQDDGRIVVGGTTLDSRIASGQDFALLRLMPDGALDAGFGNGGKVVTPMSPSSGGDVVYALALPRVGGEQRIVAAGGEGDFMVARYTAAGLLDAGFGQGGRVVGLFRKNIGQARSVALLPDGRMVLAGSIYNDFAAAQLTASGALDPGFGQGGLFTKAVNPDNWNGATGIVRQADGKLVLGGWAYSGNSSSADFVALRLLPGGTLDGEFGTGGQVIHPLADRSRNDAARGIALQADERIPTVRAVLGGEMSSGANDFALIRLWL